MKSYKPLIFLGFKLDHSTAGKLKTKQRWLTLTSIQNHQHMGVPLERFTHPTVNKIVANLSIRILHFVFRMWSQFYQTCIDFLHILFFHCRGKQPETALFGICNLFSSLKVYLFIQVCRSKLFNYEFPFCS